MAFQNLNLNNHEDWLRSKGFVWNDATRAWEKPRRVVPHFRPAPVAVPEPNPEHARDAAVPRKAIYPGRVHVRITSYCCGEQRDARNVFDKYGLDCLTKFGFIVDDSPKWIDLIVEEKRVSTKKEEGFEVVITPL